TPHGEFVFDEFWWDFAKQGVYLASESAPKDAKTNHREAISFGSRAATQKISCFAEIITHRAAFCKRYSHKTYK
ncbi:MAG: hypothetical protein IJY16_06035, partial [Clostridia bacterium]|nr:hypothetical protein [Clostridia bacterium]